MHKTQSNFKMCKIGCSCLFSFKVTVVTAYYFIILNYNMYYLFMSVANLFLLSFQEVVTVKCSSHCGYSQKMLDENSYLTL